MSHIDDTVKTEGRFGRLCRNLLRGIGSFTIYPAPLSAQRRNPPSFSQLSSSGSPMQQDAEAIAGDWKMVGQDLQYAINRFEKANPDTVAKVKQYR